MAIRKNKNKSNYSDSCNKVFGYWRFRTMYSIIIGFATFYLIRQNFSLAIPAICSEFHYTKSDMGLVISIGAILYGIGKCFFGVVGDRYSARYVMVIGLVLSAFMNICLGFSSVIPAFAIFWALNNCFQSMGAPPCAKLLTHWFSPVERGSRWALWSSSQQIGSAVIALIAPFILIHFGWRYIFFLPGIFAIFFAAIVFNRLRDTPESLRLPPVEKMTGLSSVEQDSKWEIEEKVRLTYIDTLKMALSNKLVWYVALANFFVYICRMTFLTWGPTLLLESKGSKLTVAGGQVALFDIAGIFGGMFAGYLSDKIFKGRRGPIGALYMVMLGILIGCFWLTPKDAPFINSICMVCIGFLVSGPQVLSGLAATDFASKKAAATANGFTGTLGYAGTAISGIGAGYLADHYGWNGVFLATIISAFVGAVFFILTWNKRSQILNDKEEDESATIIDAKN